MDAYTSQGVPFANVTLSPSGFSTMTNEKGGFSLSDERITSDQTITVTHSSYEEVSLPVKDLDSTINFKPKDNPMDSVTVTAKRKLQQLSKSNYALPIALAACAVVTVGIYFYLKA